jgi:uncharacterized protein (UPF0333 family)
MESKYPIYILAGLLAFSIFSHYLTGSDYTEVCSAIYAVAGDSQERLIQLLGKNAAQNCLNRL